MANIITTPQTPELAEFDQTLVQKIATDWVTISAKVQKDNNVMIIFDIGARQLATEVAKQCAQKGARVWYHIRETDIDAVLLPHMSDKNISRYYGFINNEIMQSDVVFMIRAVHNDEALKIVPSNKMALFSSATKPVYIDYRVNYTNWQLLYWPTPSQAALEKLSLEAYVQLFFTACNQPWDKIADAQDHIVEILNRAKSLTLTADPHNPDNNKRTKITMSIEGMEFLSSTIHNNYPGSEVFSSPVRDSVNGHLFAPGKKALGHEGKIVEDVCFSIKNGKIVDASARVGEKDMIEMLDRDPGATFFGEVALGTNPGIRRQVFNPLLNEKVGGSFHITPGQAYEDHPDDKGTLVHLDNGNRSEIHWDITILMLPAYGGGSVIADETVIQENGRFMIPGTEILNEGI